MRVLLADDHGIVRDGLRWMLRGEADIDIVAEASNGEERLGRLRDGAFVVTKPSGTARPP